MNVSPELQKHFDNNIRSDIELYLDDLNEKYGFENGNKGLYPDYRIKVAKILNLEDIEVISDPRVQKAVLDGNKGLDKLKQKQGLQQYYAFNYFSNNPYFPNEASNDENYLEQDLA